MQGIEFGEKLTSLHKSHVYTSLKSKTSFAISLVETHDPLDQLCAERHLVDPNDHSSQQIGKHHSFLGVHKENNDFLYLPFFQETWLCGF